MLTWRPDGHLRTHRRSGKNEALRLGEGRGTVKRSRAVPQRIGLAACAVAALAIAATGSGSAQAASGRLAGRTSGSTSRDTRVTTSLPAGYRVISASFTGPAGQQAYGQVTCPATSTG